MKLNLKRPTTWRQLHKLKSVTLMRFQPNWNLYSLAICCRKVDLCSILIWFFCFFLFHFGFLFTQPPPRFAAKLNVSLLYYILWVRAGAADKIPISNFKWWIAVTFYSHKENNCAYLFINSIIILCFDGVRKINPLRLLCKSGFHLNRTIARFSNEWAQTCSNFKSYVDSGSLAVCLLKDIYFA